LSFLLLLLFKKVFQASKTTYKVFKTIPSAIAFVNKCVEPCNAHRPHLTHDTPQSAWEKVKQVFLLDWDDKTEFWFEDNENFCCRRTWEEIVC